MTINKNYAAPIATYVDKYGETRRIYQQGERGALKREKNTDTVCHTLNRVAAVLIGARIKARREEAGYTLEDLCLKAGLKSAFPKNRMWELENAIRDQGMRFGTLYAVANALGCDVGELMPSTNEVLERAGIQVQAVPVLVRRSA